MPLPFDLMCAIVSANTWCYFLLQWRRNLPKVEARNKVPVNTNTGQNLVPGDASSGQISCQDCGMSFLNAWAMLQHQIDTTHMRRDCAVCNKSFSDNGSLKRHIKTVHGSKVFICRYCGGKYNRRDNFRQHQLKAHQLLTCDYCERIYNDFKELNNHVATQHKPK